MIRIVERGVFMFKDGKGGLLLLLTGFMLICFWGMFHQGEEELSKDDFIRFHVVANSDSYEDQQLKLEVRDAVLSEVAPELSEMKSVSDSRIWLTENSDHINRIAEEVIQKEGYDYGTQTEIGVRWIPEKNYGNLIFPAGNYEAFTISIGEAEGENWWCVMFPPVCIIGEDSKESKEMAERFKGTKYEEMILSSEEGEPYVLKFKTVEAGKKFLEWIKS